MKSLKFLLIALVATVMSIASASAQVGKIVYLQTNDYKLFNFGRTATLITTDSNYHAIDSIALSDDEGGVVEVTLVAIDTADIAFVTGVKIVRYAKVAGTLTVGAITEDLVTEIDGDISVAAWTIEASDDNLTVKVKGEQDTWIKWYVLVKRTYLAKT